MALTPGLVLSDRYRLTARIAVGGMGEVWEADDTRLARKVAVKILKSELTSDPEFVDRFRSEARITASLNHSGIAAVYDYGEVASIAGGPRDTAYLVMELVSGEPLSAVLARGRLSVPRTLDLLEQSGKALQVPHARALVHRDIKPGNILITPAGQVKITDFGIAKVAHQVPVTRGGMVMGTAQYLSPEQAAGHEAMPASDIYALGIVAYECVAGVRPFNGDNPITVAMAQVHTPPPPLPMDVPPAVAALVMRMLTKDPHQRFPDGGSLARAVAGIRGSGRGAVAFTPAGPPRSGSGPISAAHPLSGFPGPGPAGSGFIGPGVIGPGPAGSGFIGPGVIGPGAVGPGAVGPGVIGPGAVGPGAVGPGGLAYAPVRSVPNPAVGSVLRPRPPVNRRTGVAVMISVLVLIIAAVAALLLIQRAGSGSTSGLAPAVGPHVATLESGPGSPVIAAGQQAFYDIRPDGATSSGARASSTAWLTEGRVAPLGWKTLRQSAGNPGVRPTMITNKGTGRR